MKRTRYNKRRKTSRGKRKSRGIGSPTLSRGGIRL